MVEKLILGHMPFIGVSYQSTEKDKEYYGRFSALHRVEKIVKAALGLGIRKFASGAPRSSPLSSIHLEALKNAVKRSYDIGIIPCIGIPVEIGGVEVDPYRRWATHMDFEEALGQARQRILSDPVLAFRSNWKHRLQASKTYRKRDFGKLTVKWETIDQDLDYFTELSLRFVQFGSETDFLAIANRLDLLGELVDRARNHGFKDVLLGIHHAGVTVSLLRKKLSFDGFVTPLNSLGVMMFPTKRLVEKALRNTTVPVYAIKPLAGGRLRPREAFQYVFSFSVEGCMVGVGSISELEEAANAYAHALSSS